MKNGLTSAKWIIVQYVILPFPEGMEDVYELKNSCLNAEPKEYLKGTCHVISKIHAVKLFELIDE